MHAAETGSFIPLSALARPQCSTANMPDGTTGCVPPAERRAQLMREKETRRAELAAARLERGRARRERADLARERRAAHSARRQAERANLRARKETMRQAQAQAQRVKKVGVNVSLRSGAKSAGAQRAGVIGAKAAHPPSAPLSSSTGAARKAKEAVQRLRRVPGAGPHIVQLVQKIS